MKPILIYDGDCGFCRWWVRRWEIQLKAKVVFAPYQEVAKDFSDIPLEAFQRSVQLIEVPKRFEGAEAVFRLLARIPSKRWMLLSYQKIPGVALASEWFYRFVSSHRTFFSKFTRLF